MRVTKILFALLLFLSFSSPTKAQIGLSDLLKIYHSNSIDVAYKNASILKYFEGTISFDRLTKDSIIVGTMISNKLIIRRLGNKSKFQITIGKQAIFDSISEQVKQKLHYSGSYARSSKDVLRQYIVYSDKINMQTGDLWFIMAECRRKENKETFYEIKITTCCDQ
jgi:hypothetical protein